MSKVQTRQQKEAESETENVLPASASPAGAHIVAGEQQGGTRVSNENAQTAMAIKKMQQDFQRQMHSLQQLIASNNQAQNTAVSSLRQQVELMAESVRTATTAARSSQSGNSAQHRDEGDRSSNVATPASGESLTVASLHSQPPNSAKKIYPLLKFEGEPEVWPAFIEDFRRTTQEFGYTDLHNIMRIRESLHGRARATVESLLCSSRNVGAILEVLEETFGRPELLIKSQIEVVRKLPKVNEGNLDELVDLAVKVNNMAAFLKMCQGEHHLTNPSLLSEIVAKLPLARQMQWAEKCASMVSVPNVEDFSKWLTALRKLANFVADTLPLPQYENNAVGRKANQREAQVTKGGKNSKHVFVSVASNSCVICQKDCDDIINCGKFLSLDNKKRWQKVKEEKLCFLCLKPTHRASKCTRKARCGVNDCTQKHHGLLHNLNEANDIPPETNENNVMPRVNLHVATDNQSVLFQILPVNLFGPKGVATIYAFVDDGADVTMLDWGVAQQIGLQGKSTPLQLQWLNGSRVAGPSKIVECDISGVNVGDKKYKLRNVYLSRDLALPTQTLSPKMFRKFPHVAGLPVEQYKDAKPKMILSLYHSFLTVPVDAPISPPFSGPVAINTRLGWILYGPASEGNDPIKRACHVRAIENTKPDESLDEMMRQFFEIESCGVKLNAPPVLTNDIRHCLAIMNSTLCYKDGRYECGLLWKKGFDRFPSSFAMAKRRFDGLEKRMQRDREFGSQYCSVIDDFLKKGYARRLSPTEAGAVAPKTFYLPHFGVVNPNKKKVRLVFDAAAKCDGLSLNDALLPGPDLNQPLSAVLMKFREGKIAVCGDLKEMFLQVAVKPEDQDALRFLWRANPDEEIGQYAMTRMIFGATCSPTIAQFVKNMHAQKFAEKYDRAVKAIVEHHYVDDFVDCFPTEQEAIRIVKQVKEIHGRAGFELCKIISNSKLVNEKFGEQDSSKVDVSTDRMERVLGLFWLPATDEFVFDLNFHRVPADILEMKRKPTKRELLCVTMSIFDPFGFLGNFVITAKIMMQLLWKSGAEWDEPIPDDVHGRWVVWLGELVKVRDFKIPRCYFANFYCASKNLHIFSDASEQAMATVAYWRLRDESNVRLAFVMGKTNCAPTRAMSIPRLELQAAVYAVRLKNCIEKFHGLSFDSVQYWSDSHTVIRWVNSETRMYKQFVANRIAEILEGSHESEWRWVPGAMNPADDATRAGRFFEPESRWKSGPTFLLHPEETWPAFPDPSAPNNCDEELKSTRNTGVILSTRRVDEAIFDVSRFSNYHRLWRAMAWLLRFLFNARSSKNKKSKRCGALTVQELEEAEIYLWRPVQRESYGTEYEYLVSETPVGKKSELKALNPYLDKNELIRCSGRIDNAPYLQWESKRPLIIPKNHRLTRLLVEWYHKRLQHVNKHTVISEIRLRFWIPSIRVLVNSVFSKCLECRRRNAKPSPPIMGLLPRDRLTPLVRPFTHTGVDYFGPVEVSCHRRREKRWVALFTCLATRAVHLEVAVDLSSDACLVCIRNFINRRGVPKLIRSDNGTNFVGLAKELGKESHFLDHDAITEKLAPLGIEWKFNTPANPSAGGVWERLVRSVKRSLSTVLKEQAPRVETLISLLIECENVVNSRPLTHLPVTPTEPEPLTPNHFLLGCPNSTQTPASFDKRLCALRKQWRILQNLKNLFWQRWMQEYLPELTRRVKWCRPTKPLTVGALVLVCEAEIPRSRWKKGKITKLLVAPDGVARSAVIQTTNGLLRRPVSKLAPLDVVEEEEDGECPAVIHGGGDVKNGP